MKLIGRLDLKGGFGNVYLWLSSLSCKDTLDRQIQTSKHIYNALADYGRSKWNFEPIQKLAHHEENSSRFTKFNNFIHQKGLVDLGKKDSLFLGRIIEIQIKPSYERLDSALTNHLWLRISLTLLSKICQ